VSILDTSAVVDYLTDEGPGGARVRDLLEREGLAVAPDLLVVETLAVLRRFVASGALEASRATAAVADLGAMSIQLYPSLPLRSRIWGLRDNMTAADAAFVALAETLDEPLVTKDHPLAVATRTHTSVTVVEV
jgi:predicted nucleic acid-binding protein